MSIKSTESLGPMKDRVEYLVEAFEDDLSRNFAPDDILPGSRLLQTIAAVESTIYKFAVGNTAEWEELKM